MNLWQKMMENIVGITNHLRSRITGQGQDPRRRVLEVIPARNGDLLYADPDGGCWRVYRFIAGASAYDTTDPEKFYQVGRGFGHFQKLLIDYPADSLYESIPYFHNTRRRFDQLIKAIDEDTAGRVGQTKNEIDFIFDRRKFFFGIFVFFVTWHFFLPPRPVVHTEKPAFFLPLTKSAFKFCFCFKIVSVKNPARNVV